MRRISLLLLMVAWCAAAAAPRKHDSASPSRASTAAELEQQLRDADLDFAKQTAARGLDGWMDFFADDASIITEGKTVNGHKALRAFYEPVFADKDFILTWKPARAEASKDGTLGYTYGDYEARRGATVSRGMYTTVWRREAGRWKVVLDLGSAARPQPVEVK